ncbi:MAG: hypothetical protein AB1540_13275 [Bdellovibrionota bacterium]
MSISDGVRRKFLALGLLSAVISALGCAKSGDQSTAGATDPAQAVALALVLPLPDNSYSVREAQSAVSAEYNARVLVEAVDSVADPLKESKLRFAQVVSDGEKRNGFLHIVHSGLNAELKGTEDSAQGKVNWEFYKNGALVFSGSSAKSGVTGDLTFPVSATGLSQPLSVHWSSESAGGKLTKNVVVRQGATGSLTFAQSFAQGSAKPSVKLSGRISGGTEVKGEWETSGGKYEEPGFIGCWDSALRNAACN